MILTKQLSGTMVWANPRGVWAILPKKRLTTRYNTAKLSQLRRNMEAPLHRDTARKKEKKREKNYEWPSQSCCWLYNTTSGLAGTAVFSKNGELSAICRSLKMSSLIEPYHSCTALWNSTLRKHRQLAPGGGTDNDGDYIWNEQFSSTHFAI